MQQVHWRDQYLQLVSTFADGSDPQQVHGIYCQRFHLLSKSML